MVQEIPSVKSGSFITQNSSCSRDLVGAKPARVVPKCACTIKDAAHSELTGEFQSNKITVLPPQLADRYLATYFYMQKYNKLIN